MNTQIKGTDKNGTADETQLKDLESNDGIFKSMSQLIGGITRDKFLSALCFMALIAVLLMQIITKDVTGMIIVAVIIIFFSLIVLVMFLRQPSEPQPPNTEPVSDPGLQPCESFDYTTLKQEGTVCIPSISGSIPAYTFYGYNGMRNPFNGSFESVTCDSRIRNIFIYQDFNVENGSCLQNMWSDDTNNSYINSKIIEGENVLRVEYYSESSASNITIKPYNLKPYELGNVNTLIIRARKVEAKSITIDNNGVIKEDEVNRSANAALAFGVRIINGYFQHWSHSTRGNTYRAFTLGNEFMDYEIPLNRNDLWKIFMYDGNTYFEDDEAFFPNNRFKYVIGINLGFGIYKRVVHEELVDGSENIKGIIEISKIFFK